MKNITLTLAISTLSSRLEAAISIFSALHSDERVEFLILVQGANTHPEGINVPTHIRLVFLDSIGLSNSRNSALKLACGDFIWFLDDDISIEDQDIRWLIPRLTDLQSIYVCQIRCSDCHGLYKDYSRNRKGKLGALRISSIEIIAPRLAIEHKGITFNSRIGLGTGYPSGEENLFIIDAIENGIDIIFLEKPVIGHPCQIEERKPALSWRNKAQVKSKGVIARQVGGTKGLALIVWWGIRASQYNRSLKGLAWIVQGYLTQMKQK